MFFKVYFPLVLDTCKLYMKMLMWEVIHAQGLKGTVGTWLYKAIST